MMIVIPCYNEEKRFPIEGFLEFGPHAQVKLLFVDDGSSDATQGVLHALLEKLGPMRAEVLTLPKNVGKGDAVRQGILHALKTPDVDVVGFLDADLATPPSEVLRILSLFSETDKKAIWGSRVAMLGTKIDRHASRHYVGRVFATFASLILAVPVYDTQCGAKFFRRCAALQEAFSEKFASKWGFDVELIGRLLWPTPGVNALVIDDFLEVPLKRWTDVPGTKMGFRARIRAGLDLWSIHRRLKKRRRLRAAHARR